jgi:hypothetical protein
MKLYSTLYQLFLFATLTLATTGCYIDVDDDDGFNIGPTVQGSGNVITEGRIVDSFSRIEVEGAANIILRQGTNQMLQIEADDNIVPIITTRVRGNELEISNSRNYRSNNPVNVYITIPVVSAISIDGSGDVFGQTAIEGDQLELDIDGSGDMDLEIFYTQLFVESNGSGDFQIIGDVVDQVIRMSGSGNYDAWEMTSENCDIRISGSGDASVFASEFLKAEIRGSGNIKYYGNPRVESSVTGSGDIISAP